MFINKIQNRRAFTIVEVIIASAILIVVISSGYEIFSGVSKGFAKGTKALSMQNEMRNALNFLREEMQRASYWSKVSISGTEYKIVNYEFKIALGGGSNNEKEISTITGSNIIAEWCICKPFDDAEGEGYVFNCSLKYDNGVLIYTKKLAEGKKDENEAVFAKRVIMKNVNKLNLSLEAFDPDKVNKNGSVLLKIVAYATESPKGNPAHSVSSETAARIDVKVVNTI